MAAFADILNGLSGGQSPWAQLADYNQANPGVLTALGTGMMTGDMATGFQNAAALRTATVKQNKTKQWLMAKKGMDEASADAAVSNPAVLSSLLKGDDYQTVGKRLFDTTTKQWVDMPAGGDTNTNYALTPIYGTDAKGNTVIGTMGDDGSFKQVNTGGFSIASGVEKVDLGTQWGLLNKRTGQIEGYMPKDVAGAASQEAVGKAQGAAQFDLPRVEQNAQESLDVLEKMKNSPGRERSTGFIQGALPATNSDQVNFQSLVDQTKGQTFLQAYQMLKGGGAITEIEGQKAENAISRLSNLRLSDDDYLTAINDLESVIKTGLARARVQAGKAGASAGSAAGANDPLGIR